MWGLYSKDPEHWIPIATIASFKRMREYQPHGNEWLVQALKKSDSLEVDAEGKKVRRTTEVKEPKVEDAFARSVYAVRLSLNLFVGMYLTEDCRKVSQKRTLPSKNVSKSSSASTAQQTLFA